MYAALELRTVPSTEMPPPQLDAVIALCAEIVRCDYAYHMAFDLHRVRVLGDLGERPVAHALWLERRLRTGDGPRREAANAEGVATHADFRGRGHGSAALQ